MKKRLFSLAIILVMLFSLVPAAYAAGEPQLTDGDFIYMGVYKDAPIKWKLLDADATNTGEAGAFLLTEYVIDPSGTDYHPSKGGWQGSDAQKWCGVFADSAFTTGEQTLITAVSKTEEESQLFGLRWGPTELKDEKVFFLSSLELAQYVGDKDGAPGLSANDPNGKAAYWWLRTSHRNHPDYSGLVIEDNQVHDFLVFIYWGCRPAVNLDLSKVLCVSPAYEGAQNEWKLTAVDEKATLTVEDVTLNGDKLNANYTSSAFGDGQYIYLLVKNADDTVHSSRELCTAQTATGTVEIDLSTLDIPEGGKIYLFSRHDNGDYMTDTASQPVELACKVAFDPGEGSGEMDAVSVIPGMPFTPPDCAFSPAVSRMFDHWELDGVIVEAQMKITSDSVLTACYKDIPISSVSFAAENVELELFDSAELTAYIAPEDAADKTLTWQSDSQRIISIEDMGDGKCVIKAKSPGTATVAAVSNDGGATGSVTVNVTGSVIAAFAVNYGLYVLGALAVVTAVILLLRRKREK